MPMGGEISKQIGTNVKDHVKKGAIKIEKLFQHTDVWKQFLYSQNSLIIVRKIF